MARRLDELAGQPKLHNGRRCLMIWSPDSIRLEVMPSFSRGDAFEDMFIMFNIGGSISLQALLELVVSGSTKTRSS